MSTKVLYVAGVPASGKSTLFKLLRQKLFAGATTFKEGKVRGIENGHYKMLGVFDGSLFEGTDRLSMSVIDDAISYVKKLSSDTDRHVVFVEGDRLFNIRFMRETRAVLLLIDADESVLRARHIARGDTQNGRFLKSRRSKVENFARKYGVKRVFNNTEDEQQRILDYIIKIATEYVGGK